MTRWQHRYSARNADIRRRLQAGEKPKALAAEYGISQQRVSKILHPEDKTSSNKYQWKEDQK